MKDFLSSVSALIKCLIASDSFFVSFKAIGEIDPNKLITHHFKLDEILHAYEVFGNASVEKAMKVIIEP